MRPHLLALAAFVSVLPLPLFAQSLGDAAPAPGTPFSMTTSPQYPAPGGTVMLSFLSSSLDLANASVRVSANGKTLYDGSVRAVAVPLGRAGSVTTVSATVDAGGSTYTQTLSLQPEDVVLVAEPVASAPALYPGKPGVPIGGTVRVVAVANLRSASGAALSPAALSYAWTVDDTRIADASGIGKSAIMVASPLQFRARTVSVAVTSADGSLSGGASLTLSPVDPVVRIYENDPLLGVRFERALSGTYNIANAESSLFAASYSFPAAFGGPNIAWFLDGAAAQTGAGITLRPTGAGAGQASLSAVATAGEAKAVQNLTLSFGQTSAPNFFGL